MPKFNFPMTYAQFTAAVRDKQAFEVLGGDIEFAYSCLRMGWMNKQHHKEKTGRDQEQLRRLKELMKTDKELEKRLMGAAKARTV